jgi:hypothetical protein
VENHAAAGGEHSTPAGGEHSTPAGGEHSTPAGGEHSTPAGGEHSTPAGDEGGAAAADGQLRRRASEYVRDLEMNSWHQAELHITAAGFWGNFQWVIGGAAAVFAATASGTAFAHYPLAAGILALLGAGSAAVVTALRPGDISAQHLKSATEFNQIQNDARNLWEFSLERLDASAIRNEISWLGGRWNQTVAGSPRVPRRLFHVSDKRFGQKGMYYFPKPRRRSVDQAERRGSVDQAEPG